MVFAGPALAEDPVYFPDPNLKAAVERSLGISAPTPTDMLHLTELVCKGTSTSKVTVLAGLEYAQNLVNLDLRSNQIWDLSALCGLTSLSVLNLTDNPLRVVASASQINQIQANNPAMTLTYTYPWKNQVTFSNDPFCSFRSAGSTWIKFTILTEPYDPNVIYFQNSKTYKLHYDFSAKHVDPFVGMSSQQFYEATLLSENPSAVLGTVLFPPTHGAPPVADFNEYGIQFVRYDREEIRDLFHQVRASVAAPPGTRAMLFPSFEQQATAEGDRGWFESQGIPLGSMMRWAKGNTCYSEGWALGRLKYFTSDQIYQAYQAHELEPNDILLTDGVPAEIPVVAGVLSLAPSTPNSHVAILSRTYFAPFVHLALKQDADLAQGLVGHRIIFTAYEDSSGRCETRLLDTEGLLDEAFIEEILQIRQLEPLRITPMAPYGAYGVSTDGLSPSDVQYVGGKAANFGLLRTSIPANSPRAMALTFDLWNAFLDQGLASVPRLEIKPGQHVLIWADGDEDQGPTHAGFKLSADGESIALFDADGTTLIDAVHFGPQNKDVSYGRSSDGNDTWQSFIRPTQGRGNSAESPGARCGLVINEFMANNQSMLKDPCEQDEYPDWIELYNGSDQTIVLNGLYLTDDVNDPTQWRIPPELGGGTLREEVTRRLSAYDTYPPADVLALSQELASIRSLFTSPEITRFGPDAEAAVLVLLTDPGAGFDPNTMLRFRSSTNVEDSDEYTGAGLYASFSGCPADDLDGEDVGPCWCDPNEPSERGVFRAIRRTFASFYNDNAFLERLHRDVNEAQVGMAVLVNPSFPDELELANGVATLDTNEVDGECEITLVSQLGAISVTNPEDGSIPEEVLLTVLRSGAVKQPVPSDIRRTSSLVPLGGTVMAFPKDYKDLGALLVQVSNRFSQVTGRTSYMLDLEYKKVAPGDKTLPSGGLVIKQVRPVPEPNQTEDVTPFLVNSPMEFEVFTGECELLEDTVDVFAQHRLKSRWWLETHNMTLDANSLQGGLYGQVTIEYVDEDHIRTVTEPMSVLAQHGFDGTVASDTWRWGDLATPRVYQLLTTGLRTAVSSADNPIFILEDLGTDAYTPYRVLTLDVTHDDPVMEWRQSLGSLRWTTKNRVYLWPCQPPDPNDVLQERSFTADGTSIRTSFYYPAPPEGHPGWVGSTAPLKRWGQTVIEGLTSEPIILQGYYSQTCRPEHHNLVENFLFEPQLESGISPDILDQLRARDIRFIQLTLDHEGGTQSKIRTYGF